MLKYALLTVVAFATPSHAECNQLVGNWVNAGRVSCPIIADGDQGERPAIDPRNQRKPSSPPKPAA